MAGIIKRLCLLCLAPCLMSLGYGTGPKRAAVSYSAYLDKTVSSPSSLVYEPTLILNPTDVGDFTDADASAAFYDAILETDDSLNAVVGSSTMSLTDAIDTYLKGKYVPVVRITDSNVGAFLSWYNDDYEFKDMMVISSSIDALNKVHEDGNAWVIGSVYDLTEATIYGDRYDNWDYIGEANAAGCNVFLLDGSEPNLGVFAEYASLMGKVAWARTSSGEEDALAITKGCYGIVSSRPAETVAALSAFDATGWAAPQRIAAHRGITKYCNENSLTAIAAAWSEGADAVEIDLQITADEQIVICHDSETNGTSDKNGWYFVNVNYENLVGATLSDYSARYGETYPLLEEVIGLAEKLDLTFILELKFDNGSTKAVEELRCIENFAEVLAAHPGFMGHFYCVTFFEPLALKMKELLPEVPLGYLGGAQSGYEQDQGLTAWSQGGGHKAMNDYAGKISFLKTYNMGLDENHESTDSSGEYYSNLTAGFYLARGYVQNTWTYDTTEHFAMKSNMSTSNGAEQSAYLIKDLEPESLTLAAEEASSLKVTAKATSYCGWESEAECDLKVLSSDSEGCIAMLYAYDEEGAYGRYSAPYRFTFA